jgi:uncharacterized protein (DUF1778 family)
MNNLKLLIRSFEDKPMQTLTDFILKFAGIKAADVVAFKNAAPGNTKIFGGA